MKAERLFRVLGLIDPKLIEEAAPGLPVRRHISYRSILPAAACLVLVCFLGIGWLFSEGYGGFRTGSSSSGTSDGMGIGHTDENSGITFMKYSGPVFPLTTFEDPGGLKADRLITWDFAPGSYADGELRQWGAAVTDAYQIYNPTDQDITVTALYPFAGNFSDLPQLLPSVTVDGAEWNSTGLYAGPYSGGFQSTFGADLPDTMNLDTLDSWTEYKALLESGEYLEKTLGETTPLNIPVTVYHFTDFAAPHEKYQAATQAISFTIDESATQILTYGINGYEANDSGFRRYSYFVPDGRRRESEIKLLIVLGEDIQNYELQGYKDGGCEDGEEIDGVSCTVTRTETTLDTVLDQLCQATATDSDSPLAVFSYDMYRRAAAELLVQYGPLSSSSSVDRYADGRLDDILWETMSHDRVLYLSVPLTIPAGCSISVSFQLWKPPSYDFHCSGTENVGLQGYDLVTRLGSKLEFTSQTAALVNTDGIILAGQNFGFDLEQGHSTVLLDLEEEHYYLEIWAEES